MTDGKMTICERAYGMWWSGNQHSTEVEERTPTTRSKNPVRSHSILSLSSYTYSICDDNF